VSSSVRRSGLEVGKSPRNGSDPFALEELKVGGPVDDHRRYYAIAGITMQVESDLPFGPGTFKPKFDAFAAPGPGDDTVVLRHHFELPELDGVELGPAVYDQLPWTIHEAPWGWAYLGRPPGAAGATRVSRVVAFTADHTAGRLFNGRDQLSMFTRGGLAALTLMPTDQVLLARLLADRRGCFLHSCGIVLDGAGVLFVGESGAGKSTAMEQFAEVSEPLCDDRNIVRAWPDGVRVHGTWSHGTVPIASAASAPLRAICLLRQARENRIRLITDRWETVRGLVPRLIRPLATGDWWPRTFDVLDALVREVPCYELSFDRRGGAVAVLRAALADGATPVGEPAD
jgi:hypothetical protein